MNKRSPFHSGENCTSVVDKKDRQTGKTNVMMNKMNNYIFLMSFSDYNCGILFSNLME